MADKDEVDPTQPSGPSADPGPQATGPSADSPTTPVRRSGSHPLGQVSAGRDAAGLDEPGSEDDLTDIETDDDTSLELVPVGAAAQQAAGSGDVAVRGRQKKAGATPRQKQLVETQRRTGPVTFLRESVSELQKVVYPTGQQLANYFVVVLIFVLFIIAIVSVLDLAFGKAIIAIFS